MQLLAVEPTAVPALSRRAVERVTTALTHMDDSSGGVGADLHALMEVHAQACSLAPPDTKRLAAWLAKIRLDGPGWPDFELRDYATALGENGRAELGHIVEERAATAEADVFGSTPFEIRILREQLAEVSGDVDYYVSVVAADLRTARQFLKIVNALRDADRACEAEQWACRGLGQLGNPIEMDRLRDVYVELLLDRGAEAEALALRQQLFDEHPVQSRYFALRRTAERTDDWPGLRAEALQRLRDAVAARSAFVEELLGVLLDEHEHAEAWQVAVAHDDVVSESRWKQLIELRQPMHPADVIEPWKRLIEQRLAMTSDKYRYRRAITMLRRLSEAYRASGNDTGFQLYLADLRHRHKRKTSLLAKLDNVER
ncbi:hypothetical protein GIY23_12200 [Allosaccharopolyspora coralli]|uniref:Uncharacterized protein n=1 Tax=Allosaccharopolyspora coralli TaxID=2665642 RepID=A0A5Q3Q9Z8_9PSEU|nr:hypothetical protein [Allosaccharopolyspora coralli]QGK70186.1 hypothetical protein GIY23_12200 [Allosaccharopolyspora coralli]